MGLGTHGQLIFGSILVLLVYTWSCSGQTNDCVDADSSGQCALLRCGDFPDQASKYCSRTCGVCRDCVDRLTNCTDYGQNICTDHRDWSVDNCPRFCKFCDCYDRYNCSALGPNACTRFNEISRVYCRQFCNLCTEVFHPDMFKTGDTSIPDASERTTRATTSTTTTTTPSTTTANSGPHTCDKLMLIEKVASSSIVTSPLSGPCLDGSQAQSEAVVNQFCHAPSATSWTQGLKVLDNCDTIPMYSAIGTFLFGRYPRDARAMSGVFLGCERDGFRAIFQICGYPPAIEHLTHSGGAQYTQNPGNFYVVDW